MAGRIPGGCQRGGTEAGSQRVSVLVQMKVNFLALEVGKKVKAEAIPFLAVRGAFPWSPGFMQSGYNIVHSCVYSRDSH